MCCTKVEHQGWSAAVQLHPHVLPLAACLQKLPAGQHLLKLLWGYALYDLWHISHTTKQAAKWKGMSVAECR